MKRMKKYILTIILCLLVLSLAGCQNGKKTEHMEWKMNASDIEGLEGRVNELAVISEGKFYVATAIPGSDESVVEKIYYVDLDEKRAEQIPFSLEKEGYVTNITNLGEKRFAAFLSKTDSVVDLRKEALIIVDREGKIQANRLLTEIVDSQKVVTLLTIKSEKILLVTSVCVYELDANLNSIKEYWAPAQIENATVTEDGQMICICLMDSGDKGNQIQYCRLNPENGKWEKNFILKLNPYDVPVRLISGQKGDFFLLGTNGIYECDEKGTIVPVVKYAEERLGGETWHCLTVLPSGKFFSCANADNGSVLGYLSLEKAEAQETKIVVGGLSYMDHSILRELKEYHQAHPDVAVEIREYECDYRDITSINDACARLNADVLSGNGPDIVFFAGLDWKALCQQGMLENLDPYFEKDSEISKEDMIFSLRETISINGNIYGIVPSFGIMTLAGKTKLVGDSMGWTMKEAYTCWKKNESDVFAMDGKSAFYWLIYGLMQNAEIDMTDIRMALEMANTKWGDTSYVTETNVGLKEEKTLLAFGGMTPPQYIQVLHAMFDEDNITLKGFPGLDGSGAVFSFNDSLGISSNSLHKDIAWDMVRPLMSKKYQSVKSGNLYNFPSRKDCFEEMLQEYTKKKSEYNQYLGMEMNDHEDKIIVDALSKEDVERIRQMVYEARTIYYQNYLLNMVTEEAASYFSGEKELDEVYEIIRNRLELYYKENHK